MSRRIKSLLREIKFLLSNSLQGQVVKIIYHPDPTIMELKEVTVIEETRGTLVGKCNDGEYRLIPKSPNAKFQFQLGKSKVILPGTRLLGLPRQRRKQRLTRW